MQGQRGTTELLSFSEIEKQCIPLLKENTTKSLFPYAIWEFTNVSVSLYELRLCGFLTEHCSPVQ